ncbi:hypothetical protein [uncultured Gammaproteobacteria bacterium]|nr:hypothetical protein [uncultured Gammaproteobacteria bacterium]VVH55217.1 hypothetical protein BSPCLSOX_704 [uncultured Gammaproteobacteria bacterium]
MVGCFGFLRVDYLCKGLVVIEVLLLSTLYDLIRLVFSTKSIIMRPLHKYE